ncbi:thymidylate synthase [Candidatus Saccharibacteria bacterium]|nr:thymidylate synthase [Candidatus Saccharibacteria bacterium]
MARFDEQYLNLCERILRDGEKVVNYHTTGTEKRSNTTASTMPNHLAQAKEGATTIRIPHQIMQFDLSEEFPILTTKFVAFKAAVLEMLWIWQEQSNKVSWLQERGVKIWNEWEIDKNGDYMGRHIGKEYAGTIGTAYGWVVNRYQLTQSLIDTLKNDTTNRRMVMSLWQNEFLPTAALPSCVWSNEWIVTGDKLNVMVHSRSSDVPLGLPFNIAQYAVLCHLIAQSTGLKPGVLTFTINDAHIYENQIPGIEEQLRRRDEIFRKSGDFLPAPKLWVNPKVKDFFKFDNSRELRDIRLEDYQHQGKIKMAITA